MCICALGWLVVRWQVSILNKYQSVRIAEAQKTFLGTLQNEMSICTSLNLSFTVGSEDRNTISRDDVDTCISHLVKDQPIVTSLTLILDFADDSRKAQLHHCLAKFCPCSLPTTRSSSRSHLLPTRIMGTCTDRKTQRAWLNDTPSCLLYLHWFVKTIAGKDYQFPGPWTFI